MRNAQAEPEQRSDGVNALEMRYRELQRNMETALNGWRGHTKLTRRSVATSCRTSMLPCGGVFEGSTAVVPHGHGFTGSRIMWLLRTC